MYACLAVTCHLHFWQNDRDFLHATVVTRGWNGYRNKSQHRKSTLEKKILPPFQQGFEPATFQSRVRRSNHWAIPAPLKMSFDDELMLNVLRCHLTYQGQVVPNAEARFNKIHIRKVYACLAVTCHLHFWQNDRDFLRATVVTRGWNGYRNKSQHRKSTLEKKILPPFQQGFEPATFQSRVRCSNHWAIPAPQLSFVKTSPFIPNVPKWALWKLVLLLPVYQNELCEN